jgi:uncharacterized protein (DUF4415 family)
LSPEQRGKGEIGKFCRPNKAQISFRIDADVMAWVNWEGEGHLSRINTILPERMMTEGKRAGRLLQTPASCGREKLLPE